MDSLALAREVIAMATRAGASSAEILIREGSEFSTLVRLGSVEKVLQAGFRKLGVRVLDGRRAATSATSDFSAHSLELVVKDTLAMARAAGEDPAAGIPDPVEYSRPVPGLSLSFPTEGRLTVNDKISMARECECAALDFDPRINNSEGAGFNDSMIRTTYANSLGVATSFSKSVCSLNVTPLAEVEGVKQRDTWISTHLDFSLLQPPTEIGAVAARRTLRRLGARKIPTCEVPVVFEPMAAASVLRHVADAVSGTALTRRASFLMGKLGETVASRLVTIIDDPLLVGAPGSRPFDSEGIPCRTTAVISRGVLESFLLDSYSGRKLGLRPTGNSNREPQGSYAVGPSNFYLEPGSDSPDRIIASVKRGIYVSELIGFGVNIVSGDFSQGAAGGWIEDGAIVFPVEGITIAGNLKDMLTRIEAVGNDLLILGEVFSPTLLIGRMVVSGS
jgi:PmbA protein